MNSSLKSLPVLYSFRRCPYAIRARMTLAHCAVEVEHREVLLANKPDALLRASPKGSVPVLILTDGVVLDESLDIMRWALMKTYPLETEENHWRLSLLSEADEELLEVNDGWFKTALDGYKYGRSDDVKPPELYREDAEKFLLYLERRLIHSQFFTGDKVSFLDVAIFPFIRQFSAVDPQWFDGSPYVNLRSWLYRFLASELFSKVMTKHPVWSDNSPTS
jgi:glutathione S-transferase